MGCCRLKKETFLIWFEQVFSKQNKGKFNAISLPCEANAWTGKILEYTSMFPFMPNGNFFIGGNQNGKNQNFRAL